MKQSDKQAVISKEQAGVEPTERLRGNLPRFQRSQLTGCLKDFSDALAARDNSFYCTRRTIWSDKLSIRLRGANLESGSNS